MKLRVEKCRRRQLLILAALFMMTLATAFAQDSGEKTSSYAQVDLENNLDTGRSHMNAAEAIMEEKQMALLDELLQPDPSNQSGRTATEEPCGINECALATPR